MIDIRKLKELVRLMVANDLTELDLRDSEEQVTLRREGPRDAVTHVVAPAGQPIVGQPAAAPPSAAVAGANNEADTADSDDGLIAVESPMVGTFYPAPDPDSPPFVKVGDAVDAGTVVCLIEAMKIFNEIKCDQAGSIVRACVSSGDSVEFGQPLFMVKPA